MPQFIKAVDIIKKPCEECGGRDFVIEEDFIEDGKIVKCAKCGYTRIGR